MKPLKSALLLALPLMLSLSACASHKYVDTKITGVNSRLDGQDAHLGQLDKTTQEALDRATSAGKLAEGKFVYSIVLSDDSVKFDSGKAVLSDAAKASLTQLADRLKADNKNVFLEIQGYTDATGTDDLNYRLGTERADSVRRFLNTQGVALIRMASISYGAEHPVAPNTTSEGRSANRRVVIVVLS
ncbi:OmpA family protein [Asticcacaulis benevestitus]|uniref:Flagellar motor protein MotB n=1 Tax=Asticcacaulis benevestitus DSM 16100 = ATCC BAA-896 TaxID=1121022 RepID=V4RDJ6_9CAUL|nr:OmpA family protein [Asticcacaulis benevestitus]ESQ89483.1 flagellar motor protein MotB [Asticcacaulis benevestitus DSM 16100 = ATCC BAA-896]